MLSGAQNLTFWAHSTSRETLDRVSETPAPRPGELLISTSTGGAGIFNRSVVLLLDTAAGALGMILNQPSEMPVEKVLPQWHDLVDPPQHLFAGGPVSVNGAICVAKLADPAEEPPGFHRAFLDVGLVHLDTPVELVEGAYSDLRIFAGYSGWDVGQLENELADGRWHRASGREADIFGSDPRSLWRRTLKRVGGEAALLAGWAESPELN